ncbi:2-oxo-4-hydroxy-4-carboxy-5-ureidoimidazoline decarboxylase [Trichothermofontia sichuanensis B231]|uniref:2-oxo-4-hydroxy-4-carboxy-5-ureidoimidazoline decarboxylase n=1 Tax=Trichothermofontia sichuanensis TaxID=3045816 RepID=UPI0022455463|nr:2-oxo-4-hydroxy-4-carboxy-5-ureidoimidazoline decarboxylase [Trichothermofontia sichuanensis]UZQ54950.1 2-oxo-4-hydroxy-4-carboxy-5-ureidoimidazoline decarboxylase [Trichothermofontia sichuanensis B231]
MYTIADLNQMDIDTFAQVLGGVFEATPTIARLAWSQRPFTDAGDLYRVLIGIVQAMEPAAQLALIRAHPDLGSRAKMTDASLQEQASVGLDQLTAAEYDRFQTLNQAYWDKFGFPFIIAVRNHTKASILQEFERRLQHTEAAERQNALAEIYQIARFRLAAIVQHGESPFSSGGRRDLGMRGKDGAENQKDEGL